MKDMSKSVVAGVLLALVVCGGCAHQVDEPGEARGFWNTVAAAGIVVAVLAVGNAVK